MCRSASGDDWCVAAETAPARNVPRARAFSRWSLEWDVGNELPVSGALFAVLPSRQYLVFQTDGLLCRPFTPEYIEALSAFDYVGAPWTPPFGTSASGAEGGNGGLSFRSADVLARVLEREYASRWFDTLLTSRNGGSEDIYFSKRIEEVGGRLPQLDFARSFAVEMVPHPHPWGFHKPWTHLAETPLRELFAGCPVIAESLKWARGLDKPWDPMSVASCRVHQGALHPLTLHPTKA